MEENTKPQWLIDAEAALEKFNQSEFGKKTEAEIKLFEKQRNASLARHAHPEAKKSLKIWQSAGGKSGTSGKKNVESGHWKKVQQAGTEASLKLVKCEHCQESFNTGNYSRWHGDHCEKNPNRIPVDTSKNANGAMVVASKIRNCPYCEKPLKGNIAYGNHIKTCSKKPA
jgi:hypothetical protein